MNRDKTMKRRRELGSGNSDDLREYLFPFQKVAVSLPANVYYLGAPSFPIPERERRNIKELIDTLQGRFTGGVGRQLFSYLGVIHSMLKPESLRAISMNNLKWRSMTALALLPNQPPPRIPGVEEAVKWEGNIPLDEVLPMITYITKQSVVKEAYDKLFGAGALAIYISPLEEQQFFKKTKGVFGYTIEDDALKIMNCLPFFVMDVLLQATEKQFRALFSVLDLYIGESVRDNGYIVASSVCLDDIIIDMVDSFKRRGLSF